MTSNPRSETAATEAEKRELHLLADSLHRKLRTVAPEQHEERILGYLERAFYLGSHRPFAAPRSAEATPVNETVHELKTWPEYYGGIEDGSKPFEIRKLDRPFRVGDVLYLREWDPIGLDGSYTGRSCRRRITTILSGPPWLPPNYGCMGLAPLADPRRERAPEPLDEADLLKTLKWLQIVVEHEAPALEPSHEGSCGPHAACDGGCADAYYFGVEMTKARYWIALLEERAKTNAGGVR